MASVGVFVDAGYLFAQGSAAVTGSQKPRATLTLNETAVVSELSSIAQAKSGGLQLLRIYWYDAARSNQGLSIDHTRLAYTDHIKLRLGFMNSQKQQKGVDSLIVTDLIELARNHAMTDALLLSGDEDVRIGVQIAQSFGVRVHLLGIIPCRGSQSPQLMQEADTTTEWDAATVAKFLAVSPISVSQGGQNFSNALQASANSAQPKPTSAAQDTAAAVASFDAVVGSMFAMLDASSIGGIKAFWLTSKGLPPELDGKLLVKCRTEIGRDLDTSEKRIVRRKMCALIQAAP